MDGMTFSEKQDRIVHLIAAGYSNDEIAVELGCSTSSVKQHVTVLRYKLGVGWRRLIPYAYAQATGIDPYPRIAA